MPFSGISDFIRNFGTRFRDIYNENVDKGRKLPQRKDCLIMKKINKVAPIVMTLVMSSCVCKAEVINVSALSTSTTSTEVIAVPTAETRTWTKDYYGSAEVTGATADELNELIDKIIDYRDISYCPFKGKGDLLKEYEENYGISSICLLSIWTWESSFGTSSIAKNRNNYGGITGDGGYKYFASIEEGMEAQAKLLSENYIEKGYVTYSEIGKKYCPVNPNWADNVRGTAKKYAGWLESIMG